KGFAAGVTTLPTTSPANVCGTRFVTGSGNSSQPPDTVPAYMGVLVASSVTKSGSSIDGVWAKVVVVKTASGYAGNPGDGGTGTIGATFCGWRRAPVPGGSGARRTLQARLVEPRLMRRQGARAACT